MPTLMGFMRTGGDDGQNNSESPADDYASTDLELSAADIDNPASSPGVVARITPSSRGLANSFKSRRLPLKEEWA
jgi:hypothetical protein